jgi:hypothetical protein
MTPPREGVFQSGPTKAGTFCPGDPPKPGRFVPGRPPKPGRFVPAIHQSRDVLSWLYLASIIEKPMNLNRKIHMTDTSVIC